MYIYCKPLVLHLLFSLFRVSVKENAAGFCLTIFIDGPSELLGPVFMTIAQKRL